MEINEDILIRYIDGMLTEEEAAEVKNWRAASLENEKLLEQVYFTTQVAGKDFVQPVIKVGVKF